MIKIAKHNTLPVHEVIGKNVILDGGAFGLIDWKGRFPGPLPKEGEEIGGFVYSDEEGYLYMCGQEPPFSHLNFYKVTIADVSEEGAMVDWKRPMRLIIPRSEQIIPLHTGDETMMLFIEDEDKVLCYGTTKFEKYFNTTAPGIKIGKETTGIALDLSPIGYRFLLNEKIIGFMYLNEVAGEIQLGSRYNVNVKWVRPDGKIDLTMQPLGYENRISMAVDTLLEVFKKHKGYIFLNDKSTAEEIKHTTGMSKKLFKMAIGKLLKDGRIEFWNERIKLKR